MTGTDFKRWQEEMERKERKERSLPKAADAEELRRNRRDAGNTTEDDQCRHRYHQDYGAQRGRKLRRYVKRHPVQVHGIRRQ